MTHLREEAHILIVDDEPAVRRTLMKALDIEGYVCHEASDGTSALQALGNHSFELMICDLRMPEMDGMELIESVKRLRIPATMIVLTGHGDIEQAVEATHLGAYDFLNKPVSAERLRLAVARALEHRRMALLNAKLTQQVAHHPAYANLVGESVPMLEVFRLIAQVASTDTSVLITGETGTGKEQVARAIHEHSQRRKQRLNVVDCAAIPDNLVESVLFGHMKGSFTGADRDHEGMVSYSDGGTLFFDEIGDLPLQLQSRLLRLIQERTFSRVGDNRVNSVNVRIIAATNKDLLREVRDGHFREDLYYRMNVLNIHLAPLRQRGEDATLLAFHFLTEFAERFPSVASIKREALDAIQRYSWPGNVRELSNAIERAASLTATDAISLADLPEPVKSAAKSLPLKKTPYPDSVPPEDLAAYRIKAEREYFTQIMLHYSGNITHAAAHAGVARNTFYRALRDAGLSIEVFRSGVPNP